MKIIFLLVLISINSQAVELLVRMENKPDAKTQPQAGDVLLAKPDGWHWGKKELSGNMRVIAFPGIKMDDPKIKALLEPEYDNSGTNMSRLRSVSIGLEKMESKEYSDFIATKSVLTMTTNRLDFILKTNTPIVKPDLKAL